MYTVGKYKDIKKKNEWHLMAIYSNSTLPLSSLSMQFTLMKILTVLLLWCSHNNIIKTGFNFLSLVLGKLGYKLFFFLKACFQLAYKLVGSRAAATYILSLGLTHPFSHFLLFHCRGSPCKLSYPLFLSITYILLSPFIIHL